MPLSHEQRVTRRDAHVLPLLRRFEIGRRHVLVRFVPGHAARGRDVEQHAASKDALLHREDRSPPGAARRHRRRALAPVVQRVVEREMRERVEMRDRHAMRRHREVVADAGAVAERDHQARGVRVHLARRRRDVAAQRNGFARLHELCRGNPLRGRDVVQRAQLVIRAPPPSVRAAVEDLPPARRRSSLSRGSVADRRPPRGPAPKWPAFAVRPPLSIGPRPRDP